MKRCGVTLTTALAMLINLFGMGLAPLSVTAAPASTRYGVEAAAPRGEPSFSLTYDSTFAVT